MTSYQSVKKCRKDHIRYKASRTKEGICSNKVRQLKRKDGNLRGN